jgi:hypothetical protein
VDYFFKIAGKKKETGKIQEKMKPADHRIPEVAQVKEPAYRVTTPNHEKPSQPFTK